MRILIVVGACVASLAACNSFLGPEEFTIRADSVRAPAVVKGGAAFQVLVYGPVGPNGCHRFKEFRVTRANGSADVTIIGERRSGTCTQMPVSLIGEALTVSPPVSDPFVLRLHQPNGTVLSTTIRAE